VLWAKQVDTILEQAKGPDGTPIDLTDPVARHQFLSDTRNENLMRRITHKAFSDTFSEFLGSKAGALTGKIADVAAPGMNPIIRYMGENAISNTTKDALINSHKTDQ
jgi:hypothetical protein|tara:strand:- start:555 stop:875 length:321 start_codon:yes stop_codon:yes gene_type:complete